VDQATTAAPQTLASCRKLAREFTEGVTAKNLRELTAEIEQVGSVRPPQLAFGKFQFPRQCECCDNADQNCAVSY
jgi:hypothetical protein